MCGFFCCVGGEFFSRIKSRLKNIIWGDYRSMIKKILLLCCFLITPIVSANAVTCNVGEYADGDFCYECPANAECPDGIDFVCDSGWYKNGNICSKCSVENSTCTNGTDYNCLPGFYDDENMCKACPANATCAGGHEFFYCNDGYFKQSYGGTTQCLSCANHVCEGETLISCGEGYFKYHVGYCYKCIAETDYCPAGSTSRLCKEGYYNTRNGPCAKCPDGYFCPQGEANYQNYLDYCASGYYRTGGSCSKCDDGVVCPGGKIDEMVCPDGLYKHDDGRCLNYAPGDCGTASAMLKIPPVPVRMILHVWRAITKMVTNVQFVLQIQHVPRAANKYNALKDIGLMVHLVQYVVLWDIIVLITFVMNVQIIQKAFWTPPYLKVTVF